MLKFYYNPISPNARRVWITLLEKDLPFESEIIELKGDQFQNKFLEINPFHHIPVIVDDSFRIVESLAILDYLEAKYPTPAMLPADAKDLATVRMVQMLSANELFPATIPLICEQNDSQQSDIALKQIDTVLNFFIKLLGDRPYFGSQHLTLADIVAGIAVHLLPNLGVSLSNYPTLTAWSESLMQRPAWAKTQLSHEEFEAFKRRVKALVRLRRRSK